MKRLIGLSLLLAMTACSSKQGSKTKANPKAPTPSAAAFFTSQQAWCTIESGGKVLDNVVDRFDEVFVFKVDGSLTVLSFDLDERRRIRWNAKGQPRLKPVEQAKFRVDGQKLIFVTDADRQSAFEKIKSKLDEKDTDCFRLKTATTSSVHCACALPEDYK